MNTITAKLNRTFSAKVYVDINHNFFVMSELVQRSKQELLLSVQKEMIAKAVSLSLEDLDFTDN